MVKKQKGQKLSLKSFLDDDSFGGGSWADEEIDYSSISVPVAAAKPAFDGLGNNSFSEARHNEFDSRPQRREFPVPDVAPFKARINNLPWDVTESDVARWVEEITGPSSYSSLVAPQEDGRLKGFAFVTFNTRDLLVQALDGSGQELNGRRVYIAVAAPDRDGFRGRDDFDWNARRGPLAPRDDDREPHRERAPRGPRSDAPEPDWGARRGPLAAKPFETADHPRERAPRAPRSDAPEPDWSARRGPLAPKPFEDKREHSGERRERKPRADFDWGARKGPLEPKEGQEADSEERKPRRSERKPKREEPEFDWSTRRGPLPAKTREPKDADEKNSRSSSRRASAVKKSEKPVSDLDWSSVRVGGKFVPAKKAGNNKQKESEAKSDNSAAKPKKSLYHLLSLLGSDDEADKEVDDVTEKTEKLNV